MEVDVQARLRTGRMFGVDSGMCARSAAHYQAQDVMWRT